MIFAAKLGPVRVGDGDKNVYVGFTDDWMLPPVVSRDDEEGLWGLVSYGPSGPRFCDESLARAGRTLGFEVTPTPAEFIEPLGTIAVTTALGMSTEPAVNPDVLAAYARSAAAFDDAGPWVLWHSSQAVEVSLVGEVTANFEMSIMGAGGEQFGISLYRDRRAVEHVSSLVATGRAEDARKIDFLSMSLESGSDSIVRALASAFELWCVPLPVKIKDGERISATELDLLVLAATLRATSELTATEATRTAMVRVGGKAIVATVRTPEFMRDAPDLVE